MWATQRESARDNGWHRTGDVGHLDGDGRLWIEGRMAHLVTTADDVVTPVDTATDRTMDAVDHVVVSMAPEANR